MHTKIHSREHSTFAFRFCSLVEAFSASNVNSAGNDQELPRGTHLVKAVASLMIAVRCFTISL